MSNDRIGRGVIETAVDNTQLKAGIDEAKRSVKSLGNEVGTAMADGSARAQRSIDSLIKKLELQAGVVGKTSREIKLMELTQRGATEAQLKAADAALKTLEAHKLQASEARKAADAARTAAAIQQASQASQAKAVEDDARRAAAARAEETRRSAMAAALATRTAQEAQAKAGRLSAQQNIQLGYQLNDFFVQVASGQSPLTAAIQQGSQLSGVYGGMGNALRAVTSIFTVSRVAIGSAAVAMGSFAFAVNEGYNQSIELAKSLALTGNAAGMTEGKFNSLAKSIAEATKTTVGSSRGTTQGLVGSGRFSGAALEETAKAAQLMSKVTGASSEDVVKQFVNMTDGVAKWAETTNRSYHFLTAEQLKYVKALEDQGNAQKAIEVTMRALNDRLGQAAKSVGTLESAWSAVKRAASSAWDAMLNVGREKTLEDQIRTAEESLKALSERASTNPAATAARKKIYEDQIAALKETLRLQGRSALVSAETAESEGAKTEMLRLQDQYLTRQQRRAKEITDATAKLDRAGATPEVRRQVLAGIEEKYKELMPKDLGKQTLDLDISKIEAKLGVLTNSYKNAESIMEATRSAGLMSEKEYYDQKRKFIDQNAEAQIAALEKESALLSFQPAKDNEAIENQKKIAQNAAKITEIRADAAAKGQVLDIQQAASIRMVSRAYEEARIAAQDYLNTLTRQQGRELDAFGMGDKDRARIAARQQVEDRYNQQRLDLESNKRLLEMEGKFSEESRAQYEKRSAIINEFQGKALGEWDKYYAAIGDKESNWANGASRAFENYIDVSKNVARQTEDAFTGAFRSMEDAIVDFTVTGKASFGDLARSIVADIVRIQVRQNASGLLSTLGKAALSAFTGPSYNTGGVSLPGSFNPTNHTGGIVGEERTSTRFVRGFPSNAPRYHTGGIAGDEVPTILKRGEGVFTQGQMRNLAPVGSGATQVNVNIINNTPAQVTTRETGDGGIEVLIEAVDSAIGDRIASGIGSTNAAMKGRYGLRESV